MTGEELRVALASVVGGALGDRALTVDGVTRLSGGASRETWSFDAVHGDGTVEGLILRRDPPGAARMAPGGMGLEARVITAAAGILQTFSTPSLSTPCLSEL